MSRSGVAKETLSIIEAGEYVAPSGARRELRAAMSSAIAGTRLYRPDDGAALLARAGRGAGQPPQVEVTGETTAEAARRLSQRDGIARVAALNFASAKNPGGGFLGGAKAQEEDLARCSGLYACLLTQREYYDVNRACPSMLYTDHIIYSPAVPFFRGDDLRLLDDPFVCSIITAPAPNAGEAARHREDRDSVSRALRRRAGMVFAVAEDATERCLVLGAWGCGVFRNDPVEVAHVFATWLASERFRDVFERVVFAIYDRSAGQATRRAFEQQFATS